MSIEAIKEALAAGPTDGPWTVEVGGSPSVAIANDVMLLAKTLGGNDDANAAFIAACNPVAIRSMIERMEAAEKDAARYRWLKSRPVELQASGPDLALWEDSLGHAICGDAADAAIDSAMEASK